MDIVDPELIERLGQAEEEQTDEVNEDEDELGEPAEEQEGGTWGGWFSRLNTESIAKIAADAIATVKRDIDEFKNAVAVDSATVVDSVESSLPELAAKVSTQIDGVGENIESYGHSIFTGTTELFTQMRDAVAQELESSTRRKGRTQDNASQGAVLQRFEAQVTAMQRDSCTYCDEPEDFEDFDAWIRTFSLEARAEDIAEILRVNSFMSELHSRIVPLVVETEVFWSRYFYRLAHLEAQHGIDYAELKRAAAARASAAAAPPPAPSSRTSTSTVESLSASSAPPAAAAGGTAADVAEPVQQPADEPPPAPAAQAELEQPPPQSAVAAAPPQTPKAPPSPSQPPATAAAPPPPAPAAAAAADVAAHVPGPIQALRAAAQSGDDDSEASSSPDLVVPPVTDSELSDASGLSDSWAVLHGARAAGSHATTSAASPRRPAAAATPAAAAASSPARPPVPPSSFPSAPPAAASPAASPASKGAAAAAAGSSHGTPAKSPVGKSGGTAADSSVAESPFSVGKASAAGGEDEDVDEDWGME